MTMMLRLSEHNLSKKWLAQFRDSKDRALATQFIDGLRLISLRELEASLASAIVSLQERLDKTIAVYPVTPPNPKSIIGYHPFEGGITDAWSRFAGRREQYGSEGRVGHMLTGLQREFERLNKTSTIECAPTVKHIRTQKIQHIVFVDDVCGSGTRILDFWQNVVPKSIKSRLSYGKIQLWIIVYATTAVGRAALKKALPPFPIENFISAHPELQLQDANGEIARLCNNYASLIGMPTGALGYKSAICPVIFEYGCPNNLPVMLWKNTNVWAGLFPNRAIPLDLNKYFDNNNAGRAVEALWRANQPYLALGLLEALEGSSHLKPEHSSLLTVLGLRLRNVSVSLIGSRTIMTSGEVANSLRLAEEMGLYDGTRGEVTELGGEVVSRFRERHLRKKSLKLVDEDLAKYYPLQCEGKRRSFGKTSGGNGPLVP